jgi:hypothetical protein
MQNGPITIMIGPSVWNWGERTPGISWCRLVPVASGVREHIVGPTDRFRDRRFFNDHLLAAPHYRWWLRQILAPFFVIPQDHGNQYSVKSNLV